MKRTLRKNTPDRWFKCNNKTTEVQKWKHGQILECWGRENVSNHWLKSRHHSRKELIF